MLSFSKHNNNDNKPITKGRKEGRNPYHNLCPVGKAVSRTFLTALRPWPKADAENQPSELGCERCAMLAGGASRGRRNEVHNSNHLLRSEAHLTPE